LKKRTLFCVAYCAIENGNTTVTANIYVKGANANKLREIQANINKTWNTSIIKDKDGKTHTISFNNKCERTK